MSRATRSSGGGRNGPAAGSRAGARAAGGRTGRSFAAALLCLLVWTAAACDEQVSAAPEPRPDVVAIDAMAEHKALERPPVVFLHDRHTEAMAAGGGGACTECHLRDAEGLLVPQFQRLAAESAPALMEIYHDGCGGCHQERKEAGLATGPVVCGECHRNEPVARAARVAAGFDLSLHARHVAAAEEECVRCHHEAKGDEKPHSCRDCHRQQSEEDRRSMRLVAHQACIACHLEAQDQELAAGPAECSGCHGAEERRAIEPLAEVPRLDRGQPGVALLKAAAEDRERSRMQAVPFRHADHEGSARTCRDCHHETLQACTACHALSGKPEGGGVTLEAAMHDPAARASCVGCHNEKKEAAACAGCHGLMAERRMPDEFCSRCHSGPPDGSPAAASTAFTFADAKIPETIVLGTLADKYEPASFPHRKIIDALSRDASKSRMAVHFHGTGDMLCSGCHHSTPAGMLPPGCGSCHSRPFDPRDPFVPGLTAAYHQQCIGCHQQMGLADLQGCTDCHAEQKSKLAFDPAPERPQAAAAGLGAMEDR